MTDLELRVVRRLEASAQALDVVRPPSTLIVGRAVRRRRRRTAARAVAAVSTVILLVGGLTMLARRDAVHRSMPANEPRPGATGPDASVASPTGVTLDVTDRGATADQWSRWPDNGLTARSEHLVVATDSGVLVWGGADDGAYYDTATQTWRTLPPAPLASDDGDAVGAWTGSEVVVVNGTGGDVSAAAFDPTAFAWRALPNPPVESAANGVSQAAFVDGRIVLFSVVEDGEAPQNRLVVLDDLQSETWWIATPPPQSLSSGVAVVAAGPDVIVVGQTHTATTCPVLHVLAFSPAKDAWRELPAEPVDNRADPVVVWTGSELFVGGGGSCDDGVAASDFSAEASLLDTSSDTWREASPAPAGFYSSYRYPDVWTGASAATLAPDGSPLLYNPTTDTWHKGPPINGDHAIAPNQTPIVGVDGAIVVSGGRITSGGEICCDPFSGTYVYTVPDGY